MFSKDFEQFYLDLTNIKSHHYSNNAFMSGIVNEEDIVKYLELGEEYKELGLRSIQLLQPIALGLTELMLSIKEEISKQNAEQQKEEKGEAIPFKETIQETKEPSSPN
jgi:hypothetical protein